MGRNEYGISGHLHIFTYLKHLIVLLRCNFFAGLHFYTLSKTLIACRDMQLRFLKVKTLLNNAFKLCLQVYMEEVRNSSIKIRLVNKDLPSSLILLWLKAIV